MFLPLLGYLWLYTVKRLLPLNLTILFLFKLWSLPLIRRSQHFLRSIFALLIIEPVLILLLKFSLKLTLCFLQGLLFFFNLVLLVLSFNLHCDSFLVFLDLFEMLKFDIFGLHFYRQRSLNNMKPGLRVINLFQVTNWLDHLNLLNFLFKLFLDNSLFSEVLSNLMRILTLFILDSLLPLDALNLLLEVFFLHKQLFIALLSFNPSCTSQSRIINLFFFLFNLLLQLPLLRCLRLLVRLPHLFQLFRSFTL